MHRRTYCWVFKFHNCLPDFVKYSELLVFWWVGHYKTEAQSSIQVMLQWKNHLQWEKHVQIHNECQIQKCWHIHHFIKNKSFSDKNHKLTILAISLVHRKIRKKFGQKTGVFTFGNPVSSHSLIMSVNCTALTATNSGLNAEMMEFRSKALKIRRRHSKTYCRVYWHIW